LCQKRLADEKDSLLIGALKVADKETLAMLDTLMVTPLKVFDLGTECCERRFLQSSELVTGVRGQNRERITRLSRLAMP
jgi:hypothetical protein